MYETDDLEELLGEFRNKKLLVVEPQGNFGDHLIFRGFEKLCSEKEVELDIIRRRSIFSSLLGYLQLGWKTFNPYDTYDAVYIHGGGNFNEIWGEGVNLYNRITSIYDGTVIVGPQSCKFGETNPKDVFENVDNETYFHCREKYSFEIMEDSTEELGHVSLSLSHDTALHLEASDFKVDQTDEDYTLVALRGDKESAGADPEFDRSKNIIQSDVSSESKNLDDFINTIANAEEVYTDRLHVAITAYIFNVPTTFYDNMYHKNRGVYGYSLSDSNKVQFEYLR